MRGSLKCGAPGRAAEQESGGKTVSSADTGGMLRRLRTSLSPLALVRGFRWLVLQPGSSHPESPPLCRGRIQMLAGPSISETGGRAKA